MLQVYCRLLQVYRRLQRFMPSLAAVAGVCGLVARSGMGGLVSRLLSAAVAAPAL